MCISVATLQQPTFNGVPENFNFWGVAEAQVARQFSGAVLTFATLLPNAIL